MSTNPMSRRSSKGTLNERQEIADTFKDVEYKLTSFNIEKALHKQMKIYALEHELTMTELIHSAIRDYMTRNK